MPKIFLNLFCPNCGKKINEADQICPHCGTDLETELEEQDLRVLATPYLEKARQKLESRKNFKGALADCDQALEYIPQDPEAHNLRGQILEQLGKTSAAIRAYQEAVRLDPDFENAKENLAGAKIHSQKKQEKVIIRLAKLVVVFLIGVVLVAIAAMGFGLYTFGKPYLTPKRAVIFEPDLSRMTTSVTPEDLTKTAKILKQRWSTLGYAYPMVSFVISKDGQIIGQIPTDIDSGFINRTKAMGLVEFVDFGGTPLDNGTEVYTDFLPDRYPKGISTGWKFHTIMTNNEIKSTYIEQNGQGSYYIAFTLTDAGKKIFADHSEYHVGTYLGVVVDKVTITSPRINSPIMDGNGIIEGGFTKETAQYLETLLGSPPLSIPLK